MKRWTFNFVAALSLLLCVAMVVLWVRSYIRCDWLQVTNGPVGHELTSYNGRLIYLRWQGIPSALSVRFESGRVVPVGTLDIENRSDRRFIGITVPHGAVSGGDADWWPWACPYWLLVLVAGFMPVARFWIYRRRRAIVGHCVGCGYNLTGNVSGVCPECGKAIEAVTV